MREWLQAVVLALADLGPWAAPAFLAAYVAASLTMAPAFVLTVAAGALFGLWQGTVLAYVGATLGASAAYGIAFPLARSRLLAWVDRDPRAAAVRQAVVGQGAWIMFLLRLSPVLPFGPLNYLLALAGARYRDFLVATIGMLPATVMYAYYGKVVGDVARIAAGVESPRGAGYYAVLLGGLAATVLATTAVTRAARAAIARARDQS